MSASIEKRGDCKSDPLIAPMLKTMSTALTATPDQRITKPLNRRDRRREVLVAAAKLWVGRVPDGSSGRSIWVYNVCDGGIAFRSQKSVDPTMLHYIRLEAGPIHLDTALRIVWTRRRDDGIYEAGAQFVKEPDQT